MSSREVRDYIADLLHYAEAAVRLVGASTLDELAADERSALALERALEILGEAAGKLPREFRDEHPDLLWREMIGVRQRLAHAYFATDLAILHRVRPGTPSAAAPALPRARHRGRRRPPAGARRALIHANRGAPIPPGQRAALDPRAGRAYILPRFPRDRGAPRCAADETCTGGVHMRVSGHDTLGVRRQLQVGDLAYDYFSIPEAEKRLGDLSRLPFSLKVLLENLLRYEDGRTVTVEPTSRRSPAGSRTRSRRPGDRLPPGPRADAGLHRRARRGRPRGDARRHARRSAATRRRSTRWSRSTS